MYRHRDKKTMHGNKNNMDTVIYASQIQECKITEIDVWVEKYFCKMQKIYF